MNIEIGDYVESKDKEAIRINGTVISIKHDDYLEENFLEIENNKKISVLMENQILKIEKAKKFKSVAEELNLSLEEQNAILLDFIGASANNKLVAFTKQYMLKTIK